VATFPPNPLPRKERMTLRVLVVDDHPAFRRALTSALRLVRNVEVSMPDLNGIDAMRRIHSRRPDLPVVILTAHADSGIEREARAAGASGFLAKGTPLEDIVVVLRDAVGPVDAPAR
jgi:DNA-binding NarL/FixJ family response regulator